MGALKSVGGLLIMLAALVILGLLAALVIYGSAWLTIHVYPFMVRASGWVFMVDVLVLLPLAIFRATRPASATGFLISGWVYGLVNWMFGFLTTFRLWGTFGVFVGLFIAGVGVVPIGMLAALFHGEWATLGNLILGAVFWLGAIAFASFLQVHTGQRAVKGEPR